MTLHRHDVGRHAWVGAAALSLAVTLLPAAMAQGAYAYPLKGQSAQQQQKDELECIDWATQRTGVDPRRPPSYQGGYSGAAPSGQVNSGFFGRGRYGEGGGIADAGKGAAGGALVGAIAGDAGKGAAIGALSGLFIGGVKERPIAYKLGIGFCDHNHERKTPLAGFEGMLHFAREIHTSVTSPVWQFVPFRQKEAV